VAEAPVLNPASPWKLIRSDKTFGVCTPARRPTDVAGRCIRKKKKLRIDGVTIEDAGAGAGQLGNELEWRYRIPIFF